MIRYTYTCPVCGFPDLEFPPHDFTICDSCGTEFGYDDVGHNYLELRNQWLSRGGQFFNTECPAFASQSNWNAWDQLNRAALPYNVQNPQPAARIQHFRVNPHVENS